MKLVNPNPSDGSIGSSLDIWTELMDCADDALKHRMWTVLIRELAAAIIEDANPSTGFEKLEDQREALITSWLDDSLPADNDLGWILGELVYFRDIGLSWEETINFAGVPCGYMDQVVLDLKNKLEFHPDAQDAITEDLVEYFYRDWRLRFLNRVLAALRSQDRS